MVCTGAYGSKRSCRPRSDSPVQTARSSFAKPRARARAAVKSSCANRIGPWPPADRRLPPCSSSAAPRKSQRPSSKPSKPSATPAASPRPAQILGNREIHNGDDLGRRSPQRHGDGEDRGENDSLVIVSEAKDQLLWAQSVA